MEAASDKSDNLPYFCLTPIIITYLIAHQLLAAKKNPVVSLSERALEFFLNKALKKNCDQDKEKTRHLKDSKFAMKSPFSEFFSMFNKIVSILIRFW